MRQAIKKTISTTAGAEKKKKNGQKLQSKKEKDLRVLILDDNPVDAELMERQLNKDGIDFAAQRVDTRSEFLKVLKAFQPDFILADYKLPKFDGLQALELRNKIVPLTPFIIITGSISEETAVECMKQGADDYLLKDRLTRLSETVRHSLANRRLQAEKKSAEESLQTSELLYRTFIDSSTDMVFLKDDRFRHLLANRALCRFYEKPENEIIGKTDFQLMGKNAASKCRRSDEQALAENRIHVSEESFGGRTFETRKFPVKLTSGRVGVGGYIRDISERQRTESQREAALEALRESEDRYRDLVENSQDLICTHDLEGKLLSVNEAAARLTGHNLHDLLSMNMADLLVPGVRRFFKVYLDEIQATGLAHGTMRIRTASGETRYWEYDNTLRTKGVTVPFVRGLAHDITERKRAEGALRESEKRFRTLTEKSPFGIVLFELSGRWQYVNPRFTELTGYELAEVSDGRTWFAKAFPDEDYRRQVVADWKRDCPDVMAGISQNRQYRVHTKKRGYRYFSIVTTKFEAARSILVIDDITESRKAEEQIRASLREKEVLLKEIHHRVKNNLQVISGLLTLQAAQVNDERLQRMIKESQGRIWTMALIHQTLYQSGNLADIDMADYIRALSGNLLSSHAQLAMPPNVSFDLLPVRLVIDKAIPLALIINELVTNAIKHAFPEERPGEIRIALQKCRDKSQLVPKDPDRATVYELTVSDNGAGLPAGFDPKNQKSLGLQLVDMLAKQLGGTLAIESRDGTSARIIFSNNEKNEKHS